ncbi:transcriptional regulator, TetR family [Sporobacter termitidis DSM 10068]|uniref:Transcriptional regulator, TetR family n=1 Tax=Sporobacter termitidis DSM 10068 TaxID=1123282 RepID=A0A1M5T9X5_9FIRM|nr:TetR/AcrR family transcriptional regulator [Sporobacter termitidis]SHH47575.1 transcriptional regulator, TetR family [Sporobacter termitidis DSM 10068]
MAQTTKRAIAASLKKLLAEKPLDKITITDLVDDCEINRQTFYYHFKDIYDLVEWIYTSEATKALGGKKTYDTWQQGLLQIFEYVLENKAFVTGTFKSLSREHLERYLYNETYSLLISVIEEKAGGLSVRDEDKAFIANFYKYAFAGLMLDWISLGMKEKPADIVRRLSTLIQGDIPSALDRFKASGRF